MTEDTTRKRHGRAGPAGLAVVGERYGAVHVGECVRACLAAAAGADLKPTEWRTLAGILHFTAGWSKLADRVTHRQLLEEFAGVDATPSRLKDLSRRLKRLAELRLIVYEPGHSRRRGDRIPSVVGLPAPADCACIGPRGQGGHPTPLSATDRGVIQPRTGGSSSHGQGGQATPLPEYVPERPSEQSRANVATSRQPPLVASLPGGKDPRAAAQILAGLLPAPHETAVDVDRLAAELVPVLADGWEIGQVKARVRDAIGPSPEVRSSATGWLIATVRSLGSPPRTRQDRQIDRARQLARNLARSDVSTDDITERVLAELEDVPEAADHARQIVAQARPEEAAAS